MRHKKTLLLKSSQLEAGVFSYAYSIETTLAYIGMQKAGRFNRIIMETLGIKKEGQFYTWMRTCKNMTFIISSQPSEWEYHDALVLP